MAAELPDFSKVDYSYDFSDVDYTSIPEGCNKETAEQRSPEGFAVTEGYETPDGTFKPHGAKRVYSDATRDRLMSELWYLDGQAHGPASYFNEKGVKVGEYPFAYGRKHGLHISYYDDGKPKSRHPYFEGVGHGVWEDWHESGGLKERRTVVSGKQEGQHDMWYVNGQKSVAAFARNGAFHGPYREWFEDGADELICTYDHGVRTGRFVKYVIVEGRKVIDKEGLYRNGKPVGKWKIGVTVGDWHSSNFEICTVDAGPWRGGTRKSFLAKLKLSARDDNMLKTGGFAYRAPRLPKQISGLEGESWQVFLDDFGPPDLDAVHPDAAGSNTAIQRITRAFRYKCSDGPLLFKVVIGPYFQLWVDQKLMGWID